MELAPGGERGNRQWRWRTGVLLIGALCWTPAWGQGNGCVTAVDCDDGNPCTLDTCDLGQGCIHVPISNPYGDVEGCEDGVDCTDAYCMDGACQQRPMAYPYCHIPYYECMDYWCDPKSGCGQAPRNCDDGNLCTNDYCERFGGDCWNWPICEVPDELIGCAVATCDPAVGDCSYVPIDCDDGDPCTFDRCYQWTGCRNVRIDDSAGDGICTPAPPCAADPDTAQRIVAAWGSETYGGVADNRATPPPSLTGVTAVAAGGLHSLALKRDGTVVGWGANGIRYNLVFYTYNQAIPPSGLSDVVAIAAGWMHSLALKHDGTVVGWGANDTGPGVHAVHTGQATPPPGLSDVVAIAAGSLHSLALTRDDTVIGWGSNDHGQATAPADLAGVVAIAAGGQHSLALKADGTVVGWGDNGHGQAIPPADLTDVVAIEAGYWHSLALRNNGTVVGWGANDSGEATPPPGLSDVVAIAAGGWHSLALKRNGVLFAWGANDSGLTTVPADLTCVVAIDAGRTHNLAAVLTQPTDGTPPTLTAAGVGRLADGRAYRDLQVKDDGSGLKGIQVLEAVNAQTDLPAFAEGTTDPVTVRATQSAGGSLSVTIRATDIAGNTAEGTFILIDEDTDGYPVELECDDTDPTVHPGVAEIPGNGQDDDCDPDTTDGTPPSSFAFHVPGLPSSTLTLRQGDPPFLTFHLVGLSGYMRDGVTPIPTLRGCGTIESVAVVGSRVVVKAANGTYHSRDGFLYVKAG